MVKYRQTSVGLLIALCLVASGCGKSPHKLYDKAGGFSYDPPAGWDIATSPASKYQVAHGPAANGFAPNINVVDETFSGTLEQYGDENLKALQATFRGMKLLKRDTVTTLDGQTAVRLMIEHNQFGTPLRQTFYLFESGSRKYVATCSALANGGESLDGTFEESMKTFRLH